MLIEAKLFKKVYITHLHMLYHYISYRAGYTIVPPGRPYARRYRPNVFQGFTRSNVLQHRNCT
jgi:hypothetical protein